MTAFPSLYCSQHLPLGGGCDNGESNVWESGHTDRNVPGIGKLVDSLTEEHSASTPIRIVAKVSSPVSYSTPIVLTTFTEKMALIEIHLNNNHSSF